MEILYGAIAKSLTHPTEMVLTTCAHTLYCVRRRHPPFFVFPIFILSHPAWDRIKSSRYYTQMCLCLPDMFSLSGPTVITFPGFQTSTHERQTSRENVLTFPAGCPSVSKLLCNWSIHMF